MAFAHVNLTGISESIVLFSTFESRTKCINETNEGTEQRIANDRLRATTIHKF